VFETFKCASLPVVCNFAATCMLLKCNISSLESNAGDLVWDGQCWLSRFFSKSTLHCLFCISVLHVLQVFHWIYIINWRKRWLTWHILWEDNLSKEYTDSYCWETIDSWIWCVFVVNSCQLMRCHMRFVHHAEPAAVTLSCVNCATSTLSCWIISHLNLYITCTR